MDLKNITKQIKHVILQKERFKYSAMGNIESLYNKYLKVPLQKHLW